MFVDDFMYDGILASSQDLAICNFGGADAIGSAPAGVELNLNMVSILHGNKWLISDTTYDQTITTTFSICKSACYNPDDIYFSQDELRFIARWLGRKEMLEFQPIINNTLNEEYNDTFDNLSFFGTFTSIEDVYLNDRVIGFNLTFISDRPYAVRRVSGSVSTTGNSAAVIHDASDETGFIYPNVKFTCQSDGDLIITNSIENRTTVIKNCQSQETISFDEYLNISSNRNHENLSNDFNYIYFRIANSYNNSQNVIRTSIPCKIEYSYYAAVKGVGI